VIGTNTINSCGAIAAPINGMGERMNYQRLAPVASRRIGIRNELSLQEMISNEVSSHPATCRV
jgi:hypothetical protein